MHSSEDKTEKTAANRAGDDQPIQREISHQLGIRRMDNSFLQKMLGNLADGEEAEIPSYQPENYLQHLYALMALSSSGSFIGKYLNKSYCENFFKIKTEGEPYQLLWGILSLFLESWQIDGKPVFRSSQRGFFQQYIYMAGGTYSSIFAVFSSLVSELRMPDFSSRISLNPFEPPQNQLVTQHVINKGQIVLYEPMSNTSVAASVGKVLKSAFFKALLVPERLNNPRARPFFYICDEFQRFITHDDDSGEQSFLDRCRAYRVCCGLATQSVASLRYVYTSEAGNQAIKILLTNTGTKLFFRSTDEETHDTLARIMPSPSRSGKLHVVRVRPPSQLSPGECYYTLSSGIAGRGQVALA